MTSCIISSGLGLAALKGRGEKGRLSEWLNELFNYDGVCRAAPGVVWDCKFLLAEKGLQNITNLLRKGAKKITNVNLWKKFTFLFGTFPLSIFFWLWTICYKNPAYRRQSISRPMRIEHRYHSRVDQKYPNTQIFWKMGKVIQNAKTLKCLEIYQN